MRAAFKAKGEGSGDNSQFCTFRNLPSDAAIAKHVESFLRRVTLGFSVGIRLREASLEKRGLVFCFRVRIDAFDQVFSAEALANDARMAVDRVERRLFFRNTQEAI